MLSSLLAATVYVLGNVNPVPVGIGYASGNPVLVTIHSIPSHHSGKKYYLQREAAIAFSEMHAAAASDGIELRVNSAFRTNSEQTILYRQLGSSIAARPGNSNHQLGLAVDIAKTEVKCISKSKYSMRGKCPTIVYWWLKKNAHKFAFYQSLDHERWHWVYVGKND